jgi:hypothetical protein
MAMVAQRRLGTAPAFELSLLNADKGLLPVEELRLRLQAFAWRAPVWLTRAATFVDKTALFPGAVFVVGTDTAVRIFNPRYYQNSPAQVAAALAAIRAHGGSFLVVGRVDASGRFIRLDDLAIPDDYRDLFQAVAEHEFRFDISSTDLRSGMITHTPAR